MVVEGARQIGKSYIIREVGNRLYKNFIEVNFVKDDETGGLFRDIHGLDEFYIKDNVTYMPISYVMCIERAEIPEGECIF